MGLRINQNIAAMNAYRNLTVTDNQMAKSLEKLSSGYRINRAADDAAGLAISEGLRSQIGGLNVAVRNAQDGISVVQTAEGALTETHAILQRMNELAVQASNTGSQDSNARTDANTEFQQLSAELDRIGNTTQFGASKLLDGTFGAANKIAGSNAAFTTVTVSATAANNQFSLTANINGSNQTVTVTLPGASGTTYTTPTAYVNALNSAISSALKGAGGTGTEVTANAAVDPNGAGVAFNLTGANSFTTASVGSALEGLTAGSSSSSGSGGVFQIGSNAGQTLSISVNDMRSNALGVNGLDLVNNASSAITAVQNAIQTVSTQRANLGAYQNRFEHVINNVNVTVENLSASESRIRDTDMAQEMVHFTRAQILTQAGTAMLAQANQAPQTVLQLLRG
jgi:flagellin